MTLLSRSLSLSSSRIALSALLVWFAFGIYSAFSARRERYTPPQVEWNVRCMERKLGVAQAIHETRVPWFQRIALPEGAERIRRGVEENYVAALRVLNERSVEEHDRIIEEDGKVDIASRLAVLRAETDRPFADLLPRESSVVQGELVMMAYGLLPARGLPSATWTDSFFGEGWTSDRVGIRIAQLLGQRDVAQRVERSASERYSRLSFETIVARGLVWIPSAIGLGFLLGLAREAKRGEWGREPSDRMVLAFGAGWLSYWVLARAAPVSGLAVTAMALSILVALSAWAHVWDFNSWSPARVATSLGRTARYSLALGAGHFVLLSTTRLAATCAGGFDFGSAPRFIEAVVAVPILEEVLFRAFLFRGLRGKLGWFWAAVVSSAAFVVVHPLSVDRIVGGAITGMVFAWGYEKTRNLVPCVLGHAFWNFSVMVPWEL